MNRPGVYAASVSCQVRAGALLRRRLGARMLRQALQWAHRTLALLVSPAEAGNPAKMEIAVPPPPALEVGAWVRVRSREAIARTLDASGRCGGCAFFEPMALYCGRPVRVVRQVTRYFDDAAQRIRTCRNVVLLDGVYCDGSGSPDRCGCDRMCSFFWRAEWLEPIETPPQPSASAGNDVPGRK